MRRVTFFLFSVLLGFNANAATVEFKSSASQNAVIELFTSQGCSSCPPAEKWMNGLLEHPQLWKQIIPLAFHVDYWDRLGWKDIYAKPEHTDRQRRYQQDGNVRVVYTPGFFANGQEWRDWSNWFETTMPESAKNVGVLKLALDGKQVSATFDKGLNRNMVLNVAVLGFDIKTPIKAGENRGEKLPQEFVVLGHHQATSTNGKWQLSLPSVSNKAGRYALVGWVSRIENQAPIQSTGGWLPNGVVNLVF